MATAAGRRGSGERGRREGAPGSSTSDGERPAWLRCSSPVREKWAFGFWNLGGGWAPASPTSGGELPQNLGVGVGSDISDLGRRASSFGVLKFSEDFSEFLWGRDLTDAS